ncbi:ankyrin repeat-containing domain protein [Xylariaceae sp. FL1272]|nr:ankyrin repeat-containing domain protein [Xylariaceae sp. FL1272]
MPLSAAACGRSDSSTRVLSLLLKHSADCNQANGDRILPLTSAINLCGSRIKTTLLLEKGADPNLMDPNGQTPFSRAISDRTVDMDMVKLLFDSGADINGLDNRTSQILLSRAAGAGFKDVVELQLSMGLDPMAVDELTGKSPILMAIENSDKEMVELLLNMTNDESMNSYLFGQLLERGERVRSRAIVSLLLDRRLGANGTHLALLQWAANHEFQLVEEILRDREWKAATSDRATGRMNTASIGHEAIMYLPPEGGAMKRTGLFGQATIGDIDNVE